MRIIIDTDKGRIILPKAFFTSRDYEMILYAWSTGHMQSYYFRMRI